MSQKNMQPMFNKNSIEERRADIFIKKIGNYYIQIQE